MCSVHGGVYVCILCVRLYCTCSIMAADIAITLAVTCAESDPYINSCFTLPPPPLLHSHLCAKLTGQKADSDALKVCNINTQFLCARCVW